MVRCEHCQRQFNPHSAARHIPWCKKQQSEAKKRRLTADKLEALERYRWRIGYKPTNRIGQNGTSAAARARGFETGNDELEDTFGGGAHYGRPSGQRNSVSMNSSATLSSPSAGSTTSLTASIASANGQHQHSAANNNNRQHTLGHLNGTGVSSNTMRPSERPAARPSRDALRRSVSSVTLAKQRCNGSASSRNSTNSTTTIQKTTTATNAQEDTSLSVGGGRRPQALNTLRDRRDQQTPIRAKSVSDLTSMGEIVETLAKKMEAIYTQNQLLLESIMRSRRASGGGSTKNISHNCDRDHLQAGELMRKDQSEDEDGEECAEFSQCHHCRARCLVEANYCHKCGCKMRPSNPTPPLPD
jgi:hypothetical protein